MFSYLLKFWKQVSRYIEYGDFFTIFIVDELWLSPNTTPHDLE